MVSAFLFDAPFHKKPRHVDVWGIALMMLGFGCLQLVLDLGERQDWFDSTIISTLAVLAVVMLGAFVIRELAADEPLLDLNVLPGPDLGVAPLALLLLGLRLNPGLP